MCSAQGQRELGHVQQVSLYSIEIHGTTTHPGQGRGAPVLTASPRIRGCRALHERPRSPERLHLPTHIPLSCCLPGRHPIAARMPTLQGAPGHVGQEPKWGPRRGCWRGVVLGGDRAAYARACVDRHVWSRVPAPGLGLAAGDPLLAGDHWVARRPWLWRPLLKWVAGLRRVCRAILHASASAKNESRMCCQLPAEGQKLPFSGIACTQMAW